MAIEFTYLQNSLPAIICSFPFLPCILPRLLPNWMTRRCPNLPLAPASTLSFMLIVIRNVLAPLPFHAARWHG